MKQEWYVINDIEDFVDKTRVLVFNHFGSQTSDNSVDSLIDSIKPEDQKELDSILSHEESMIITQNLAKKQVNKKNNKTRYLISDDIFYNIVQSFNDRMVSNMLNNLVNKGLVETAFDEKSNDFVFWIKDNDKNQETETD